MADKRDVPRVGREFLDGAAERIEPARKRNDFIGFECARFLAQLQIVAQRDRVGGLLKLERVIVLR